MNRALHLFAIACIFVLTSGAWMILGGVMSNRSSSQAGLLRERVADLWGQPHVQAGPALTFSHTTTREVTREETSGGVTRFVKERVAEPKSQGVSVISSRIGAELALDQRLKGLMWHSLYDVKFAGDWQYFHEKAETGTLTIRFAFPDPKGVYDDFRFLVNGAPVAARPEDGAVSYRLPVAPGEKVAFVIAYRSRGMSEWRYVQEPGVASLRDFHLSMTTDFADIDFPAGTMSPTLREREGKGFRLAWIFDHVVTGHAIGMVMPHKIQPGELASALSFSAPVSLLFFFLVVLVLGKLRGLAIHPMNYLFVAAAFFAFHLLFAYSVDHIHLIPAFALSSAVSVLLLTTYLRLVVSNRFAFVEAAAAQLVYLVGFSLAHFWEGFTGLTVTVLSIATLFLLMQLTGRIRWGKVPTQGFGTASPIPADR